MDILPQNKCSKLNPKRYLRYIKLVLNSKVILLVTIISIISNSIVIFQNQRYNSLYKGITNIKAKGIVISNKEEKEYKNQYKIKVLNINGDTKYKNTYILIRIDKKYGKDLIYGDEITFLGEFCEPNTKRNFDGFDYKEYLKTIKVFGSVNVTNLKINQHNRINTISQYSNKCFVMLEKSIDSLFNNEKAELLKGILLGDSSNIDEDLKENFRISSISHILAVSGMHVSYLVIGLNLLLSSKAGRNKTRITIIVFLSFYMFITGFSPSVVRACIMEILVLISSLVHRKNDTINSLSLSLILILIYNPFLIMNIGLQFSYIGTFGILFFHNNVLKALKRLKIGNKKWKYRNNVKIVNLFDKIKEILAVTISAQLAIFPIIIYHFNILGIYFFITNLLVSVIIGPIIILGVTTIFTSILVSPMSKVLAYILSFLIQILIFISKIGELPYSKFYIRTPKIYEIIICYILIIIFNFYYKIYNSVKITTTKRRARNLVALLKYKFRQNRQKYICIFLTIIVIFSICKFIPKNLKIHFIDVGQGDSTFIETPYGKTILIDGGGSEGNFDVGKSTLLPYLLDKGYTRIDYIFISHFDQDHVRFYSIFIRRNKSKKSNNWKTI